MIPLAIPDLSGNEGRYLQECIASNFVSSVGPFVTRFETMVAEASGNLTGVATSSGTAGLHAALVAIGVRQDDLVILPSLTFIASANAIRYCGADPWLFDIDRARWNLDPERLAHGLESETQRQDGALIHRASGRRVAGIMPVHMLGMPADMDRIVAIAKAYDLPIVADGAAALGAIDKQRPIGALGANLTVFSFNGNKTVTCGGGGAVVGDDPELMDLVRHLTTTARCGLRYDHDRVGFNYRMTNLQAAVGCAQLERLPSLIAAKRRIRQQYDKSFAEIPGLKPFPGGEPLPRWSSEETLTLSREVQSGCWFSGVWMAGADQERVDAVLHHLQTCGVDGRSFWKPIHLQEPYLTVPRQSLTVCDDVWYRVVVLPCSVGLSPEDQQHSIHGLLQAMTN